MSEDLVLYDVSGRVTTITCKRPARLNAFNNDLSRAVLAAMQRFDQDPAADVAVPTGSERAFSSGAGVRGEYAAAAQTRARTIAKHPPVDIRLTVQSRRWELRKTRPDAARMVRATKLNFTKDFRQPARAFVQQRPAGLLKGR